jgi:hypothetical protein
MRKTGKLYTLTLTSSFLSLLASILVAFWNENSSAFHLWVDLVPQGFGMASFITSTLIVCWSLMPTMALLISLCQAMISGVYKEDMAVATGSKLLRILVSGHSTPCAVTYLFRTTGQVLGVSLSSTILQAVLLQKLRVRIQGPGSSEASQDKQIFISSFVTIPLRPDHRCDPVLSVLRRVSCLTDSTLSRNTEIIPTLDPFLQRAAVDSYADALWVVFICQAAINVLGFLACLPIQENSLP